MKIFINLELWQLGCLAICGKGIMRNISVKLFGIKTSGFEYFLSRALVAMLFGGAFETISVEGFRSNICVKLF